MARIERKSALAKAPALDVVAALTTTAPVEDAAPIISEPQGSPIQEDQAPRSAERVVTGPTSELVPSAASEAPPVVRRGPGRPRSRRRMEPFSSKIDIELRDRVDEYIAEHDTTFVDLLDEALRAKIAER